MNQERIGKFISERRKDKKLTQEQLAEKLGVSINAVSKWERGLCLMDMSLLKPLSKELDITINELLAGEYIKEKEIKEKADETLNQTVAYFNEKDKKRKKRIIIFSTISIVIALIIILGIINKEYKNNYYVLNNSHIMYEEHLNSIKNHMDEMCEKDSSGNWIRIKSSSQDEEYDNKRNELVLDIQECYKYLTENKDINLIKSYQIKGKVTKEELKYFNSINKNIDCLNIFSKYKDLWSSEDEANRKIYEKVKYIYSLQNTSIYQKESLTFAELNTKILFEVGAIDYLSSILYGEYRREII